MESTSLSEMLIPYDINQASFRYYLTFVNADGCKVHVPMTVNKTKHFGTCPKQRVIKELQRKMKVAFRHQAAESQPILKPDGEFFLKARVRSYSDSNRSSERVKRLLTGSSACSQSPTTHSLSDLPEIPGDLANLESFSKALVSKRIELNLSQKDVARSLEKLYGVCRSSTIISRVERMDLRLGNFLKLYPFLLRWLKDTESAESRAAIIQAARDVDTNASLDQSSEASVIGPTEFRKRRGRTVISESVRTVLEKAFSNNTHPSRQDIRNIVAESGLSLAVVRIWFRNRRARLNGDESPE